MLYARTGATAIAAALALSSTQALAQQTAEPAASTPPASADAPVQKPKIEPIVDLTAKPAQAAAPQPGAAQSAYALDENMVMLGGGALALLALGGGAFALAQRRRRRREEAEWREYANQPESRDPLFDEPMFQHAPAAPTHQSAIVTPAPSAFAWHDAVGNDCEEGETWIERAKCGPTQDNPSASLKTRLKRAAFFDKREREVEAGTAEPLDADAGLPEAMVEEQATETERQTA